MRRFRRLLQHLFNPLHVYCRLRSCGIHSPRAMRMSAAYERLLYKRFAG